MTVEAALRYKGLDFERVDFQAGSTSKRMQEIYGEGRSTVPGAVIDGDPVHGSRAILARLELLESQPVLYPSDEVREAERWGDEELQDLGRRLTWGALHFRPEALGTFVEGQPLDGPGTDFAIAYVHSTWKYHRITAARIHEDLAGLPAKIERIEEFASRGVLGGAEPTAADFQIGATIRVLLPIGDLRSPAQRQRRRARGDTATFHTIPARSRTAPIPPAGFHPPSPKSPKIAHAAVGCRERYRRRAHSRKIARCPVIVWNRKLSARLGHGGNLSVRTHRRPRLHRDADDYEGDSETDDGIRDRQPHGDDGRRRYDSQAHVGIGPRVVAVGDERRAVQTLAGRGADSAGQIVAYEADAARESEDRQVRGSHRVDESTYGRRAGDSGADEDRCHDKQTRPALGYAGAKDESNPQRERRQSIAQVVDDVGQQGDTAACEEHGDLQGGGGAQHAQR